MSVTNNFYIFVLLFNILVLLRTMEEKKYYVLSSSDIDTIIEKAINKHKELCVPKERQFVYGINGIAELFKVSRATACKYKREFLKDAITQYGKKIIVDVETALEIMKKYGYAERKG